jgi:tetratricopeptide (TPR) repeat protein
MEVVVVQLKEIDEQFVELRYLVAGSVQYESRKLAKAEIEKLDDFDRYFDRHSSRYFDRHSSNMAEIGQRLFDWLDGDERWLSGSIERHQRRGLIIAIHDEAGLGGLPWEVLYDKKGFLVQRSIIPIRVVDFESAAPINPANHLRALFMATDPIDVHPKLKFEHEEAAILAATGNLPMDLRVEESGNLEELKDLWARYGDEHKFQVFHLNGHANIDEDGVPFFITESLDGMRVDARAEDFAYVFESYYPPLIFLSGCRTGQSTTRGATTSLAADLVAQGAPAVMGWGRPVGDKGAIEAAKLLYKALAQGETLAKSLAATYKGLIKQEVPDWCLLRLYAQMDAWQALVSKQGDKIWQSRLGANTESLDPDSSVRVAGKDGFVGRRRYLQRGLRALKAQGKLGILLHGLGGVGKSTIAVRLLDRLSASYQRLVIIGIFDEGKVLNLLNSQCESITGLEILKGDLPLKPKLSKFLKQAFNPSPQPFIFVLDDFEQNLEKQADGSQVLKPEVVEPLTALLEGIRKSGVGHRIIITCRYTFNLPNPFNKSIFEKFHVENMKGADLEKYTNRLDSFDRHLGVDKELQQQVRKIADGYPRLLNWLDKVLLADSLDRESILTALKNTQKKYLENILAEKLLEQQEPELRQMLERCTIFELLVPSEVLKSICQDLAGFDRYVARSKALGLLESGLTEGLVRVPKVLGLETREDRRQLAAQAVKVLDRKWDRSSTSANEEQQIEIHRLAMLGGDGDIAVKMAQRLSNRWIEVSRFRVARTLCEETLVLQKDDTIIYNLSKIYRTLGELPKAIDYFEQSLKIYRRVSNRKGEADCLYQLSGIYDNSRELDKALMLSQQSIEIYREIKDRQGEAACLYQLSIIYRNLKELDKALSYSQQSIEICREIKDRKGEGNSLHQLSIIYSKLKNFEQALSYSEQAIEISREFGNLIREAGCLHQMSIIFNEFKKFEEALSLSEESIAIKREIGNRQGEAASLHQMSMIYSKSEKFEEALDYSEQSIAIDREICNLPGEARSLFQIARIYINLKELDKARSCFKRSRAIYKEIGDRQNEKECGHRISSINKKLKKNK